MTLIYDTTRISQLGRKVIKNAPSLLKDTFLTQCKSLYFTHSVNAVKAIRRLKNTFLMRRNILHFTPAKGYFSDTVSNS